MLDDVADYELQKNEQPSTFESRSPLPWLLAVIAIAAATGAGWYYFTHRQTQPQASQAASESAAPVATSPLGGPADAIELPPLSETDTLVRKMVGALSSHPTIAAWLASDDLLRSFTVGVENIAAGTTPARRLAVLRPAGSFRVIEDDGDWLIDPRSYERYTPLAGAVQSLDPEGTARLYSTLKPRIEDAYAELGRQRSFDVTLEEAIVAMLRTPLPAGNVSLVPKGATMYAFEDARIERLTPAQKQLARMGPANARAIQGKLQQIGLALGIPADRLR